VGDKLAGAVVDVGGYYDEMDRLGRYVAGGDDHVVDLLVDGEPVDVVAGDQDDPVVA